MSWTHSFADSVRKISFQDSESIPSTAIINYSGHHLTYPDIGEDCFIEILLIFLIMIIWMIVLLVCYYVLSRFR